MDKNDACPGEERRAKFTSRLLQDLREDLGLLSGRRFDVPDTLILRGWGPMSADSQPDEAISWLHVPLKALQGRSAALQLTAGRQSRSSTRGGPAVWPAARCGPKIRPLLLHKTCSK